jgi:hypothetical protein
MLFESVAVNGGEDVGPTTVGCACAGAVQAVKNATRHVDPKTHLDPKTNVRCFMMPPSWHKRMEIIRNSRLAIREKL